jgi:putative FmdB family regulatory protein
MPIYEYECDKCQEAFEIAQKMSDSPLTACPKCGSTDFRKLISRTSFQLKGSGWYASDYKKPKGGGSDSGTKSEAAAPAPEKPKTGGGCGSGGCGHGH